MIPVFKPSLNKQRILHELEEIFDAGWIGLGRKTAEFERQFATYVGSQFAVALNSATSALHLTLAALGIGEGDEVLVPSLTFASTALVVLYVGARPVFVDVEPDTLCLDPQDLREKVTSRSRAVIPVHYGGHACQMGAIWETAERHGLHVIEDAAHACGSRYQEKRIGGLERSIMACFSFHAVKNLPTGDGGMITLHDEGLYQKLMRLRWLGIEKSTWERAEKGRYRWRYGIEELGFKYHMNDITAVIGLAQLEVLEEHNKQRRYWASRYEEALKRFPSIKTPVEKTYTYSARHNYVIQVPADLRDDFIQYLGSQGISASVHYEPLHHHRVFARIGIKADVRVTEAAWEGLVTLPLYPSLEEHEFKLVTSAIAEFFDR